MKIYAIRDKEQTFGYLLLNNSMDDYYIELEENIGEMPVFFYIFKNIKNQLIINRDYSFMWIKERVIPYERQNITSILKEAKMQNYNELELFIKAEGKSSMDNCFLELINELPNNIKERRNHTIKDFIFSNNLLIIFFDDNSTKTYYVESEKEPFLTPLKNEIIFDINLRFNYLYLYENGVKFPLKYDDLIAYINKNVLSTKDVTNILGVTKQNVSYMERVKKIRKHNKKYYMLNDIIKHK